MGREEAAPEGPTGSCVARGQYADQIQEIVELYNDSHGEREMKYITLHNEMSQKHAFLALESQWNGPLTEDLAKRYLLIQKTWSGRHTKQRMRGYGALDCTLISRGSAGPRLERLSEIWFLPGKVARFLFEFHADDYKSLGLPVIPSSASSGTIHKVDTNY